MHEETSLICCPHCGWRQLDTVYDYDGNGAAIEAHEECMHCGWECEIDMITGQRKIIYVPEN